MRCVYRREDGIVVIDPGKQLGVATLFRCPSFAMVFYAMKSLALLQ